MPARLHSARVFHVLFFYLVCFIAACSFRIPAQGQQILSVVSAASNQPVIAPNSLATIYGANLPQVTASGQPDAAGALPTSIDGTSVSIGGNAAQLVYVSPQQINLVVP